MTWLAVRGLPPPRSAALLKIRSQKSRSCNGGSQPPAARITICQCCCTGSQPTSASTTCTTDYRTCCATTRTARGRSDNAPAKLWVRTACAMGRGAAPPCIAQRNQSPRRPGAMAVGSCGSLGRSGALSSFGSHLARRDSCLCAGFSDAGMT